MMTLVVLQDRMILHEGSFNNPIKKRLSVRLSVCQCVRLSLCPAFADLNQISYTLFGEMRKTDCNDKRLEIEKKVEIFKIRLRSVATIKKSDNQKF